MSTPGQARGRNFQVSLRGGASEIELTVKDSGIGVQLEKALKEPGLGLTSMQELPQEVSLCLFRVLQEALQNATKHSGS